MSSLVDIILADAANLWCAVGITLLIIEILFPNGFYISFSMGAFLIAGFLWFGFLLPNLLWNTIGFALFGLALFPVCKKILKFYDKTKDINEY